MKNREKMVFKTCVFFDFVFFSFFCDFLRFSEDLGVPGPSKKLQKIEKIEFLTRSFLKEGFGRVLGGFWDGFGRVLEGF